MNIYRSFLDVLIPPRCVLTGDLVDVQGAISPVAWAALRFISAPYCDACGFPFEFDTGIDTGASLCAACIKEPPVFDKARAALVYDDASRDMILGFKHGDKLHTVTAMAPWLKLAGADFWDGADVIVPVPLNRWRLLRRRYNQSALMALEAGKAIGKDVAVDALIRERQTKTQGHLSANERAANVKNAFVLNPKRANQITGKSVVLIDDVYTTGATVKECTKALLKAGASRVFVLTLAKVVRPERF